MVTAKNFHTRWLLNCASWDYFDRTIAAAGRRYARPRDMLTEAQRALGPVGIAAMQASRAHIPSPRTIMGTQVPSASTPLLVARRLTAAI